MARQQLNTVQLPTDFIQTVLSSNHTIGTSGTVVPFSTTQYSLGTKLTRSGNTVVIGTGVQYVRITYGIMTDTAGGAAYIYTLIQKNGSNVAEQIDGSTSGFKATSDSMILQVTSGDIISITASTGTGTAIAPTSRNSHLTVEVLI